MLGGCKSFSTEQSGPFPKTVPDFFGVEAAFEKYRAQTKG